jgi:hypothetical protein
MGQAGCAELCNFQDGPGYFPFNAVAGRGGNPFGVLNGVDQSKRGLFALY